MDGTAVSISCPPCQAFHVIGVQTRAANKINTDRSSPDFLVASIHMNGQMRKRRPFFLYATLLSTQFADPLVPTFLLARVQTYPCMGVG